MPRGAHFIRCSHLPLSDHLDNFRFAYVEELARL